MRRLVSVIIALILTLSLGALVFASDVNNAQYKTTIHITNNGSFVNWVSVPFTLNTTAMIDGGLLDEDATEAAMISSGGSDVAVMPGWGDNPWVTSVPTITADAQLTQYLFTKGVAEGTIAYFPDDDGMTVADDEDYELGDDFEIIIQHLFMTSGSGKYIIEKDGAFACDTITFKQISATIEAWDEYISPTSTNDWSSTWTNDDNIWDGNTGTSAYEEIPALSWSGVLVGVKSSPTVQYCDAVRIYATGQSVEIDVVDVKAYYDGDWQDVYEGTFTDGVWNEYSLGDIYTVAGVSARFYNTHSSLPRTISWYETDLVLAHPEATVTSAVTHQEYATKLVADTVDFKLYLNDVVEDSVALNGAEVQDNANDLVFFQNYSAPYVYSVNVSVADTPIFNFEWQYDDEFTDTLGNGYTATPTFRTTSSDADVSAIVSKQEGLLLGSTPATGVSGGWTMITTLPETPRDLFTEGGDAYPGGNLITEVAEGEGHPPEVYHFGVAFGVALLAIMLTFAATHSSRLGRRGSLLLSMVVGGIVLIFFWLTTTVPGWVLIPYGLLTVFFAMWVRSPSPVD